MAEKGLAEMERDRAAGKLENMGPEARAGVALARANVFLLQGKYAEAAQAARDVPQEAKKFKPHAQVEALLIEGLARQKMDQAAEARTVFLKAKKKQPKPW